MILAVRQVLRRWTSGARTHDIEPEALYVRAVLSIAEERVVSCKSQKDAASGGREAHGRSVRGNKQHKHRLSGGLAPVRRRKRTCHTDEYATALNKMGIILRMILCAMVQYQ
jgi:hypothetical protein